MTRDVEGVVAKPRHVERFSVGDEVWWNVPVVMASCNTWAPDISKPTTIIAVKDRPNWPGINPCHPQLVRVAPNYCPWGDEFDGTWLLPVGVKSHNDPAYRAHLLAQDKSQ